MQIVVVIIVFLVVVGVFAFVWSRRSNDGVEGFRREIDALSSDARRPTIDRGMTPDGTSDDALDDASGRVSGASGTHPAGGRPADGEHSAEGDASTGDAGGEPGVNTAGGAAGMDPGFIRSDDTGGAPEDDQNGA